MEENKKIKILTISDMPLAPSGVGIQTKYMIEAMLKTGKYKFISLGGAMKHEKHEPIRTEEWGEDWTIFPVDGYGNQELVRSIIRTERPDVVWFMTDPRFWGWLWEIEGEIRPLVPMVYYHVWDNYPLPTYNIHWYESNDYIVTISKLTNDIITKLMDSVDSDVKVEHIPHVTNTDIFKKLPKDAVQDFRNSSFTFDGKSYADRFVFFWNNRNARRKQSGSLIFWFKKFLDIVGHDKATLIMHTDIKDPNGQDLEIIIKELGLDNGQVLFSQKKVGPEVLSMMYNGVDCTINIADAEGFGLATFESLACETPIIVTMTGGLQEQVTDGKEWFGIGIEPTSKAIIGSQQIPFIYEDRVSEESVVSAMLEMYNKSEEEREALGAAGRQYILNNYSMEQFSERWDSLFTKIYEEKGSWENRKNYKSWGCKEI